MSPARPRRLALLVIDMQQGSFTKATPRHDADGLVHRLNMLTEDVRQAAGIVIFVQHEGPPGDAHHPDAPGFALLPGLDVRPGDRRLGKTACDAFLGTGLDTLLADEAVTDLIVTGCATDYCVDTTIRAALARAIRTLVPRDGHTTADRPHLPAAKIIEHHNAIWADFIAPGGPAILCACADATNAAA